MNPFPVDKFNSYNDAIKDIHDKIKQNQKQKKQQPEHQEQLQQNGYEIRDPHNILEILRSWNWNRSRL